MMRRTVWQLGSVVVLITGMCIWAIAADSYAQNTGSPAASRPASRPGGQIHFDQTLNRQNSASDKLQIEISKTHQRQGKYNTLVRIRWGDLDNVIKGYGKQYYSDWDGQLVVKSGGEATVVRKISFDDGTAASRPAGAASRPAGLRGLLRRRHQQSASEPAASQPGPGSGRDELLQSSGAKIVWKAGVVGAFDGLLIRITGDSPTVEGTIKAGKFTVDFKSNPAPRRPAN